ncbi:Zeta2-COP [Haematococcus lacustris]
MSFGRLHAFVIATKAGEVVYERFWDRLSEVDKAEARAALQLASSSTSLGVDDQDFTGSFRSAHFTFIPYGELVYYLVGSGEYDELACADIIRQLVAVLSDILGKLPTVSLLMDKYVKLVVIVDEIINEGLLECLDKDAIRKAMKLKAPWE